MAPAGKNMEIEINRLKTEFNQRGYKISLPLSFDFASKLNLDLIKSDQWNTRKIIIRTRKFQLSGDAIRIPLEYARRAAGLGNSYPDEVRKEDHRDKIIDPSEYALDNLFNNYYVVVMKSNVTQWVVRIRRVDGITEDKKIMRDVDWNSNSNRAARRFNDSSWLNCPVMLEGSFVSGKAADGSDNPLPEDFPLYRPWEFKLLDNEEKKVAKIAELETRLADKEEESSARYSKYQQLKEIWFNLIQNNSNDANRSREADVKRVCLENGIPLSKYSFPVIPENVPIPDIQVTDGEEDFEEETSDSETERNEEDEN
ncbi:hypothetical protein C5167_029284 [Papaver somniferum]|nr:hypothetical protein C5167_029284 [Papaver somniferum]